MKALKIVKKVSSRIPTDEAEFMLHLYHTNMDSKEHLALILGDVKNRPDVLVRVHSECFTGDVLGSQRCDCGEQLRCAKMKIAKEGSGVLIYLRQEGRGIGLLDKLRAYNLQDKGYDTVDANLLLGHQADERDYAVAALIIKNLGLKSIRLLTNNPQKIDSLRQLKVDVRQRVPVEPTINDENASYINTKVQRMNHILNFGMVSGTTHK